MPQGSSPYIFHGADVSYFSGKVRPAFPHKGLWVREIMPDILAIKRRTGLNFFPVVETPDGEMWQDTSEILDRLEAAHPSPPLFPTTPVHRASGAAAEKSAQGRKNPAVAGIDSVRPELIPAVAGKIPSVGRNSV